MPHDDILYGWALCEVAKLPSEEGQEEDRFTLVVLGFTLDPADLKQATYGYPICAISDAACVFIVNNGTVLGWTRDLSLIGEVIQDHLSEGAALTALGLVEVPEEAACFEEFIRVAPPESRAAQGG